MQATKIKEDISIFQLYVHMLAQRMKLSDMTMTVQMVF